MTSRIEVSIRFIITCWLCIAFCISFMMRILYHNDLFNKPIATVSPVVHNESEVTIKATDTLKDNNIVELANIIESDERLVISNSDNKLPNEFKRTKVVFEDTGYKYGKRVNPTVDIEIPEGDNMRNCIEEVDTSNYQYLGSYNITGYTPKCIHCCGNEKGITASGVEAIAGYTIATSKEIPFGTTLYIEGYGYYVVEDRGNFPNTVIDIAAPSHESCYTLTSSGVSVYVVPINNNTTN